MRLGEDLPQGGDLERVGAAVESCMAAIEVLEDLRHDYKRLTAAAMVAGNVWNAGAVLGAPVTDWRRLDLAQATARLTINGREIGQGKGGDVMGNPLNALAWLANKLAAAGTPLQARHGRDDRQHGADPVPAPGDRAVVEVDGLGTRRAGRDLSRCPISIRLVAPAAAGLAAGDGAPADPGGAWPPGSAGGRASPIRRSCGSACGAATSRTRSASPPGSTRTRRRPMRCCGSASALSRSAR